LQFKQRRSAQISVHQPIPQYGAEWPGPYWAAIKKLKQGY
jgi:hypothetical protein